MLTTQAKLHKLLTINKPSNEQRQQILKILRIHHYDLPQCTFQQAYNLLKSGSSSKNKYFHTRDLIQSGLQLNIGSKLKGYLQKFREALGEVASVKKLTAFVEFTVSNQPSNEHFDDLIVQDRTNYDSRKQSISVWKTLYEWQDYVRSLNEYLKQNPNDAEAWLELGDFYTQKSQYLRAMFCYQEVVILQPENDYYFLRLAELYYTDGGKHNLAVAIKYFSYVVSRNPENPRALWGLYRTLWAQKQSLQESDLQLLQRTKQAISKIYSKKHPSIKIHLAL